MGQWKEVPYTQHLRELVANYVQNTMPSSSDYSAPCSVADARKIVQNTAEILNEFIVKLEEIERIG